MYMLSLMLPRVPKSPIVSTYEDWIVFMLAQSQRLNQRHWTDIFPLTYDPNSPLPVYERFYLYQ